MFSSSHDELHPYNIPRPMASMSVDRWKPHVEIAPNCPRCDSSNTKFCYYNNYSLTQPRYFCKGCRRYWTKGGSLRNVPVGGGCRKNRRGKSVRLSNSTNGVSYSRRGDDVVRPDVTLDDMVGGNSSRPIVSGETSSGEASGSTIDLGMLYAKFLNQCPPMEEGIVVPPELGGGVLDESFDLIGSSSSDQIGGIEDDGGLVGELNYGFDQIGYESSLIINPAAEVDMFHGSSAMFQNLVWQAPEQQRGFFPMPDIDSSHHHHDLMGADWSSLDQSSFGAF